MTRRTAIGQAVEELDNEKRVRILGIIDKLRELGVSENVSLPQLVVVGDQSSGKSSLLEGLTGVSFPVASDLCTRFATQIVLRRAPKDDAGVVITIIPGPSAQADEAEKARLLSFERKLSADGFDNQKFLDIFDEAAEFMGVPGPKSNKLEDVEKRFSDDILKIELSGPEHHHLSVVDVPGLFHSEAVMDARNNLANQEVFSMARAADPAGLRTVGIITKCDALQAGEEQGVLRIAKNEVEKLNHGWFAVKNRSAQEIKQGVTIEARHQRERTFFATTVPWTELKKDRVGIYALKRFLGGLLYDHIRSEFPGVIRDIEELSASTQSELEMLGPSRQTTADQRRFLTHIATAYQLELGNALSGNYDPDLDTTSPMKLRMHIRQLNDEFATSMSRSGHAKMFRTTQGEVDHEYYNKSGDQQNIYDWIRELYRDSRGAELPGTVNPVVLENMFRQQSRPWKSIAASYIDKVIRAVDDYNRSMFTKLMPDDTVKEALKGRLMRGTDDSSSRAHNQLLQILSDERDGILQTVNHYYADNLVANRRERVLHRLNGLGVENGSVFDMDTVLKGVHISNEDQAVNDIHDVLKAYYKVAMKRFTDNVVIQVTERLVLGIEGPVRTFSPDFVSELQENDLMDIAGENFATSSLRNELANKCEKFKLALELAKKCGM
ncbi:P-loop containing nucleoside triphosphate hydrolase protein [Talaromyces proteolyticus]|uniref:P-loop containing nucleoside triphosphate hydrolase protein n=1 Tax=Talaromyces proteolyticus TaxID=1131652 RepID=A0AAD4KL03_9EURO|nr:P-loop containing nucleoside triphosphate hydrolase protein [Talaromyces proteolyticus]KAH8693853.1 P-loop containing nucleoside triphosphate hydrolase protein [Talaromyces proteolyticus]